MPNPDHWHVGVEYDDGSYGVVSNSSKIDPDAIDRVVFPVSRPWADQADLYPASFQLVDSHERNMGSEDYYWAQVEDGGPNSNQHWEMSLEYVEYADPLVLRLNHSDNVSYAEWNIDDLLDAMSNRFR